MSECHRTRHLEIKLPLEVLPDSVIQRIKKAGHIVVIMAETISLDLEFLYRFHNGIKSLVEIPWEGLIWEIMKKFGLIGNLTF